MVVFWWSPGIGDPTFAGWLTVVLYFVTAFWCWRVAGEITSDGRAQRSEERAWRVLTLLFVALGINKQLDLQSALTQIGRVMAFHYGWYEDRRTVQIAFVGLVAVVCLLAAIALLLMFRNAPAATWLAAVGTIAILLFVLIRAASFHHIDQFIGKRVLGLRWNWILEMGGILLVLLAAHWRRTRIAAKG
jgi:hypothetical protein